MTNNSYVEKIAWPKYPIETYVDPFHGEWGYLLIFSNGKAEFHEETPGTDEIQQRWGHMLEKNREGGLV